MEYPKELYYTEKSSDAEYSPVPPGSIEVERFINGKPFWRKDLAPTDKPKAMVLADWTALDWSEDKINAVIARISDMMDQGFVFYIQDGEKVKPLNKKTLSRLKGVTTRAGMSIPMDPDQLVSTTVDQHPSLSAEKIHIVDEHSIDGLLEDPPTLKRERGWPAKSITRLKSKPELMNALIQKVKPPVTYILYDQYPVSSISPEAKLNIEELFSLMQN